MAMRLSAAILVLALTGTTQAQSELPPVSATPKTGQPTTVSPPPTAHTPGGTVPCPPDCFTCPPVDPQHRFWGGAEYLLWWVQGQRVPALVTTSPAGTSLSQAGVPGYPGTGVVVGDTRMNEGARSGVRLSIGMWLDDCRTCGVGGEFFILCSQTDGFAAQSTGNPILARPIVNTLTGTNDAQIIAFPGLASGGLTGSAESQLLGASAYLRHVICEGCFGCGNTYTIETLAGYRYLNLNERVNIDEQVQANVTGAPATFLVNDSFRAENQFHGGDFGIAGRLTRGKCSIYALGKLAIGANVRDVTLAGSTGISVPGVPPANFNGGLLTAGRTGHYSDCVFAVVPEVRLGVGYQLTDCARVTLGYNLMWWTNVARAGDQIDLSVNPNLLAPATATAAPIAVKDSTLWIQGISAGLAFDY